MLHTNGALAYCPRIYMAELIFAVGGSLCLGVIWLAGGIPIQYLERSCTDQSEKHSQNMGP